MTWDRIGLVSWTLPDPAWRQAVVGGTEHAQDATNAGFSLRQVDPLIRELVHYRDLINLRTQEPEDEPH